MNIRASGILMHITSLPSPFGVGDMGPGAYEFADFLCETRQTYWQVLPLTPTDPISGHSPYSASSAFAGNTLLISPELLVSDGLLEEGDIRRAPNFPAGKCDYGKAAKFKGELLDRAFRNFSSSGKFRREFDGFVQLNSYWLDDYALFAVLKELHGGGVWNEWEKVYIERDERALAEVRVQNAEAIEKIKFLQFVFFDQWRRLKDYCNRCGVKIIGDIPIYVNYDSADVWGRQEIFKLDESRKPVFLSGVPPDYFSSTGQLWGNPVYNWDVIRKDDFSWWLERMRHNLSLFDLVRIDHFRGLVGYWEVPAGEKTAVNGRWVEAPAEEFFVRLGKEFSDLPIIAEDLGVITDDVRETMRKFDIPGMRVLLFAFDAEDPSHPYLPHNYIPQCVAYTGTHDNNTARGWFENEASPDAKKRLFRYLGRKVASSDVAHELARLLMLSAANTVLLPMQDVLSLGEEARMNRPATGTGNWLWRMKKRDLTAKVVNWLGEVTVTYGRARSGDPGESA